MTSVEQAAIKRLQVAAQESLGNELYSVTFKTEVPPSGDKHDYMSFSRYWWPNPETPDGLPYVRRDGEVNRKLVRRGDRRPLGNLVEDVQALALASHLFDEDALGARAALLVKTWFLESSTQMNPHVKFGQAVPGRASGRGVGIIDTRGFMWILDAVELLNERHGWQSADRRALQQWFQQYLQWLLASDLGREERESRNNHGSWYESQVARYAMFVGEDEKVKAALDRGRRRIDWQFDSEGKQLAELKRTRSMHYSFFNLAALISLARTGERVDVSLWEYRNPDRAGLKEGIDFLMPFAQGNQNWPYPMLEGFKLSRSEHHALRLASRAYKQPSYREFAERAEISHGERDFSVLLTP